MLEDLIVQNICWVFSVSVSSKVYLFGFSKYKDLFIQKMSRDNSKYKSLLGFLELFHFRKNSSYLFLRRHKKRNPFISSHFFIKTIVCLCVSFMKK